MRAMGAPEALIEEAKADIDLEILPDAWPVVSWFVQVADLMRWSFHGACLGLDLHQVQAEAAMAGRTPKPEHFHGLRLMGREAAEAINSRRA